MAPKKEKTKIQYYTVVFEKYLEVMDEVNKFHYMLCDKLKEMTSSISLLEWSDSPIPDFMEAFTIVDSYKIFLEEKINNPTEEEIRFTSKNNIKDVLFNQQELTAMQEYYLQLQARKLILYQNHNFSTEIN